MYATMTFCLIFVVVYAVLGYMYSHNEGSKPVLICKHCHDYCNFKSLRVCIRCMVFSYVPFMLLTTEIDETNAFLYGSQSSIGTQRCYLYHIPIVNGLSQEQAVR